MAQSWLYIGMAVRMVGLFPSVYKAFLTHETRYRLRTLVCIDPPIVGNEWVVYCSLIENSKCASVYGMPVWFWINMFRRTLVGRCRYSRVIMTLSYQALTRSVLSYLCVCVLNKTSNTTFSWRRWNRGLLCQGASPTFLTKMKIHLRRFRAISYRVSMNPLVCVSVHHSP